MIYSKLLCLLSLSIGITSAYPQQTPPPSQEDIITTIKRWRSHVSILNEFIDTLDSDLPTLITLSPSAINAAEREPFERSILSRSTGLSQQAVDALKGTLTRDLSGNIMKNMIDTVISQAVLGPSASTEVISDLLVQMAEVRCCTILPALDIVWTAVAVNEGVADIVDLKVERPGRCEFVDCRLF